MIDMLMLQLREQLQAGSMPLDGGHSAMHSYSRARNKTSHKRPHAMLQVRQQEAAAAAAALAAATCLQTV
jgi:hypothetical protein